MSWAFLPHHLHDWSKATRQEQRDYASVVTRLERMAQGLPPVIEDPVIYARIASILNPIPAQKPLTKKRKGSSSKA